MSILTSERRHRWTLFLVGYGVPLIILAITGGISYNEFGTPGFCFLSLANWLPLSFIVPLMTASSVINRIAKLDYCRLDSAWQLSLTFLSVWQRLFTTGWSEKFSTQSCSTGRSFGETKFRYRQLQQWIIKINFSGNVKFLAAMFPAMLAWGVAAVCQFSDPLDKASAYCNVVFGFLTVSEYICMEDILKCHYS